MNGFLICGPSTGAAHANSNFSWTGHMKEVEDSHAVKPKILLLTLYWLLKYYILTSSPMTPFTYTSSAGTSKGVQGGLE